MCSWWPALQTCCGYSEDVSDDDIRRYLITGIMCWVWQCHYITQTHTHIHHTPYCRREIRKTPSCRKANHFIIMTLTHIYPIGQKGDNVSSARPPKYIQTLHGEDVQSPTDRFQRVLTVIQETGEDTERI